MPQQLMHAALTSKKFPVDFRELSSTIVMNDGLEQNRQLVSGFAGQEAEQSFGICQAYHLQNVLPITRGYTSAHFRRVVNAVDNLPADVRLDDIYVLINEQNNVALYSPAGGENYIFDAQVGNWVSYPGGFSSIGVTVTNLKNESYIFYPGIGIFQYDFLAQDLVQRTVQGINFSDVIGLTAVDGRLIAWTATQIYWSSVTDPLDFTPSQSTGAGTTAVLSLRGVIVTIRPLGNGAVIYTTQNMVAMQATGNFAFPFAFSEIPGSSGIADQNHVAGESGAGTHVVWTFSGFLEVSTRQSQPLWPELSEGIARGYIPTTDAFGRPRMSVSGQLSVKLSTVGSEYIVVSVAPISEEDEKPVYNYAYVYDVKLGRWGSIRVPHVAAFTFSVPQFAPALTYDDFAALYTTYDDIPGDLYYQDLGNLLERQVTIAGQNFGIVTPTGAVHLVIHSTDLFPNNSSQADPRGYLLAGAAKPSITLGRYKIRRSHGVRLEWFNSERMLDVDIAAFSHSYTGEYLSSKNTFVEHPTARGRYYGRLAGDSVSIQFGGVFTLTDMSISMADAGKINLQSARKKFNVIVASQDANVVVGTDNVIL